MINKAPGRALLICCISLAVLPAVSQADHDKVDVAGIVQQLEDNRKLVVAENMSLSPAAADGFWRVYADYRKEIAALNRGGIELMIEFREHIEELSEDRAAEILRRYFDLQKRTLALQASYIPRFRKVITAKQTLRFYQIENKLESIIQSDMSSVTPLVE